MEPQKDNKTVGHNTPKNLVNEAYFKDNSSLLFIYRKTERIVSALYLVTNLFGEGEPLRKMLREKALCLLPAILEFTIAPKNSPIVHFAAITSYLGVAKDAGFISVMNYEIIGREINGVVELFQEYETKTVQQMYFGQSFFEVGLPLPKIERTEVQGSIKDIYHKGQDNVLYAPLRKQTPPIPKNTEVTVKDIKTDRRQKILDIVKQKGVCSIKDFSYVITDFSEKTLQRELGSLVAEGVLKKEGEKRWSTYSLA